ncbi:MAG: hypothetical protein ABI700_06355 [Chloroflexota bacterium]
MKQIVLIAAMILLLSCGAAQAQTPSPSAAPDRRGYLLPGQITSGELNDVEKIFYWFEVPPHVDMLLDYAATHVAIVNYCPDVELGQFDCPGDSGGDVPDLPVSGTLRIPATDSAQAMLFTMWRPRAGQTLYQLALTPMDQPTLVLDESRTIHSSSWHQSFRLEADPEQAFVIEIEDKRTNGDFVWVANPTYNGFSPVSAKGNSTFPLPVDSAIVGIGTNPAGVQAMLVDYMGGHEFRIFLLAAGDYVLNTTSLNAQPLAAGDNLALTLSYRNPLGVVRLEPQAGQPIKVDAQVAQGKGISLDIYRSGGQAVEDTQQLGVQRLSPTPFPLTATVEYRAEDNLPLYAVVQIANGSTRAPIRVTIQWQVAVQ